MNFDEFKDELPWIYLLAFIILFFVAAIFQNLTWSTLGIITLGIIILVPVALAIYLQIRGEITPVVPIPQGPLPLQNPQSPRAAG